MAEQAEFKLTKGSIKDLQSILGYVNKHACMYRASLLTRLETSLSYIEKSSDFSADTLKAKIVNQGIRDKSKVGNTEIPILKIQRETACAFLAGTFLSGTPIFAATSTKEKEGVAEMLTALTGRDQDMFNWVSALMLAHEDVLTNPVCAVEVQWEKIMTTGVSQSVDANKKSVGVASVEAYSGNKITRIAPENLLIDTSVPPHMVHQTGTFAGYVELMSYVGMKQMYDNLEQLYTIKINREAIFQNKRTNASIMTEAAVTGLYQTPQVHRNRVQGTATASATGDWGQFWGGNNVARAMSTNLVQGGYEVVRLYVRINLKDFGYEAADDKLHVVKLIYINGFLAYVEPMYNSHGMFPIVVGQFQSGDVNTTTFCEYLLDLQDLGTSLMASAMNSMRRAVNDRALYDETRISKAAMESPNPQNKIAVRMNAYQNSFDSAYRQIPYVDNISGNMVNMVNMVIQLADKVTGQNPATQGNFVKGNKTRAEFDTIMSNSQARMQLGALFLEQHFYSAIKQIVRANYLLYAASEDVESGAGNKVVPVDAAQLRKEAPNFKMAGGLVPVTKLAATDVLVQAFQVMSTNPMLSVEWDTGAMLVSALKQQGLVGLDQYRRTPEQAQQAAQLMQPPKEQTESAENATGEV